MGGHKPGQVQGHQRWYCPWAQPPQHTPLPHWYWTLSIVVRDTDPVPPNNCQAAFCCAPSSYHYFHFKVWGVWFDWLVQYLHPGYKRGSESAFLVFSAWRVKAWLCLIMLQNPLSQEVHRVERQKESMSFVSDEDFSLLSEGSRYWKLVLILHLSGPADTLFVQMVTR